MCKVINARQVGKQQAADRVYVGRPSKWGYPFVIGRDGSRDDVIAIKAEPVAQAFSLYVVDAACDHADASTQMLEAVGHVVDCVQEEREHQHLSR